MENSKVVFTESEQSSDKGIYSIVKHERRGRKVLKRSPFLSYKKMNYVMARRAVYGKGNSENERE